MKSWLKTKTSRPLTVPWPVTTPSPGIFCSSMPKSDAAMLDEHVPFLEGAGIEQQLDALAGRQPALGMLGLDALDAAAGARRRPFILKSLENFPHGSL